MYFELRAACISGPLSVSESACGVALVDSLLRGEGVILERTGFGVGLISTTEFECLATPVPRVVFFMALLLFVSVWRTSYCRGSVER